MTRTLFYAGAAALAPLAPFAAAPPALAEVLMDEAEEDTAIAPVLTAPRIEYTRWVLGNGLTVIALPDDTTANVTTSVWYAVGSKHDPEGRAGFAHLIEHLSSRKTANMPLNMVNRLTEDVGGQRNASNWIDRTNYYETVPAQYLETMLWTHRERMAFLVIDEETFEKERAVVKEELRQRVLAQPYGRFLRFVIPENAFDVLPLRRPGIGSLDDLDDATLEEARAFHQTYYGPDTATLIVAGNFELERLRALVDRYFADLTPRPNPVSLALDYDEPRRTRPRIVHATAPNVPLPVVGALWKGPDAAHPDAAALEVLAAIMAGGENSRLQSALVRSGIAVSAAHFSALFRDGGYIAHYGVLGSAASARQAQGALAAEIERVRRELVSEAELIEAKNELLSGALTQRQTVRGRAFELGEALAATGNPDAADLRLERIAAVTAKDVRRAARRWLRPRAQVALTYSAGDADPARYANPHPRPRYASVPPASRAPLAALPEVERSAPPPPGDAPAVAQPDFAQTQLSNGIPLVAARISAVPVSTLTLVMPGGGATDTPATAGLAAMAADLADHGTPTRSAPEIAARLEALGGVLSIASGFDGTYASITAPDTNLEAAGAVLVDIVRNASYPSDEVERERQRYRDGFASAMSDPAALADMVATRAMYGDAPYGVVGNPASYAAITRDQLLAHRETWWHPAHAKLVVSGGIAPDAAAAMAQRLFGDWTSPAAAPRPVANPAGEAPGARTIVIDMPDAAQAAVLAAVRALPRSDENFYPLWLANTVLGSGSNGLLFEEVRTRRGLAYGAYSRLGQSLDTALLTARAQTRNEAVPEVAQVFFDQFRALGEAPPDADTLRARRLYLAGVMARSLETSGGFNGQVANLLLRGIEPAEAFAMAERLAQVSPEDTARIAAQVLRAERASLVIVGDAAQFVEPLRAWRGEVEVIPLAELDLGRGDLRKEAAQEEDGG